MFHVEHEHKIRIEMTMETKKAKKPKRSALGRGLSALISSEAVPVKPAAESTEDTSKTLSMQEFREKKVERPRGPEARYLPLESLKPNPDQPRQHFNDEEIQELSESISTLGVIQPILVRKARAGEGFEIVAGERRWRASKQAGLSEVPVIISDLDDKECLEVALVENIQRSNLSPMEEARAYKKLSDEFSLSHQEIADRVGKKRASISNFLRLLNLPAEVIKYIEDKALSMGHAKAILTIKEPSAQLSLARKVIKENLSVRALEDVVARVVVLDVGQSRASNIEEPGRGAAKAKQTSALSEVEERLRRSLGTKVSIKHRRNGRGKLELEYFSEQELDRIVDHICS